MKIRHLIYFAMPTSVLLSLSVTKALDSQSTLLETILWVLASVLIFAAASALSLHYVIHAQVSLHNSQHSTPEPTPRNRTATCHKRHHMTTLPLHEIPTSSCKCLKARYPNYKDPDGPSTN